MWRRFRYDRLGRVRAWQPTVPRLIVCAAAAGFSFAIVRAVSDTTPPAVLAPRVEPMRAIAEPVAPAAHGPQYVVVRGRYDNPTFGYAFDVPDGVVALAVAGPGPEHGLVIDLERDGDSTSALDPRALSAAEGQVWTDGDYNFAGVSSVDEEIDWRLGRIKERAYDVRVLARGRAYFDDWPAVRVAISYKDRETNRRVIEEWIVGGRREPLAPYCGNKGRFDDIICTLGLRTTPGDCAADERVFEKVRRRWWMRAVDETWVRSSR